MSRDNVMDTNIQYNQNIEQNSITNKNAKWCNSTTQSKDKIVVLR